jgi:DNA repair photolyase
MPLLLCINNWNSFAGNIGDREIGLWIAYNGTTNEVKQTMQTCRSMFAGEGLCDRDLEKGLSLAARVHLKYRPVFDEMNEKDRAAVALYFVPHGSKKDSLEVTRPRVVKWYCPFADQREFPSGHRYSINVYTGCEHRCQYCYVTGYSNRQPDCKNRFRQDLCRDLEALEAFDVPPAPVHLSNSTDALQPLEQSHRHALFTLQKLAEHRNRFTTVTLLTKNPAALTHERYIHQLRRLNMLPTDHPKRSWFDKTGLPPLRLEISLAFFNDEHRRLLDPAAPSVESRMEAIRQLRNEELPVFLRIDPLFPRDPLGGGKTMADFGLPDLQPMDDLESLIRFAQEVGIQGIVYSVAKITRPQQGDLPPLIEQMKHAYQHLAQRQIAPHQRLVFRGGSWRLPESAANQEIVEPFLQLCGRYSMPVKACKANLVATP